MSSDGSIIENTLESGINIPRTYINFWNSFQGLLSYYGLKRLKLYYISLHILGATFIFLSNFPEATFIQGAMFIRDSRVWICLIFI